MDLKMKVTVFSPKFRIYYNTQFIVREVWNPETVLKFKAIEISNDGV